MTDIVERLRTFRIGPLIHEHGDLPVIVEAADEIERLQEQNRELKEGCQYLLAWLESEDAGPNFGSFTREAHPEGKEIWQEWWNRNLRLLDLAKEQCKKALGQ